MERQPQIDEMIAFIEKQKPNSIQKIRDENPSFSEILKIGTILGESDDKEELKIRATVCFSALELVITSCKEELPKLKARLKSSQRLQIWGQILTTISGASVITTLATNHKNITYLAGILSLLGALVPLVVEFLKKGLDKSKDLDDTYSELVRMRLEAERNSQELNFFTKNNFNLQGISDVINKSNNLCLDISKLLQLA
jgi:hypothetical protein